jgi:Spy/CpxP family protein refolding chaperone
MKKKIWLAGLMAATLVGAALTAYADDDQAPAGGDDKPGMGQGMDDGMGGDMMDGDHMDRMKEKLGLTDDQVSKLKDLFKSQMEANKPLRDQMKIDVDTLQQKVDMKASDGDIKKLLDKLDAEQKQMQDSREKMKDQLRSILTPTQQAKMVLGMRKMGMGMMNRWKGHNGWKKNGKGGDGNKGTGNGNSQPAPSGNGDN